MSTNELYRRTATDVVGLLKRGEVTPLELIDVAAARIAATDGAINAVPTLCLERARDHAKRLMASGEDTLLGGLPIAVKDLNEVEGVRCTHGSPIFADHIPERSDLMVETLEARGAIVIGKSNTPEFGAGASKPQSFESDNPKAWRCPNLFSGFPQQRWTSRSATSARMRSVTQRLS